MRCNSIASNVASYCTKESQQGCGFQRSNAMKWVFPLILFLQLYFFTSFSLFLFIYLFFLLEKKENNKINIRESGSYSGAIGGAIDFFIASNIDNQIVTRCKGRSLHCTNRTIFERITISDEKSKKHQLIRFNVN